MLKSLPENIVSVITYCYSAVWLSCCDDDKRPMIARLSSIRIVDVETICCYIPDKFAVELLPGLIKGKPAAVLAACTETFDSYQVKGVIDSVYKPAPNEIAEQKETLEVFCQGLVRQGFSAPNLYKAYSDDAFTAVLVKADSVFEQTPKKGTGLKLNA